MAPCFWALNLWTSCSSLSWQKPINQMRLRSSSNLQYVMYMYTRDFRLEWHVFWDSSWIWVNVVGSNPPLITCISRSFHSGNHAGEGMGSSRRGQGSTSDLCFSKLGNLNLFWIEETLRYWLFDTSLGNSALMKVTLCRNCNLLEVTNNYRNFKHCNPMKLLWKWVLFFEVMSNK